MIFFVFFKLSVISFINFFSSGEPIIKIVPLNDFNIKFINFENLSLGHFLKSALFVNEIAIHGFDVFLYFSLIFDNDFFSIKKFGFILSFFIFVGF